MRLSVNWKALVGCAIAFGLMLGLTVDAGAQAVNRPDQAGRTGLERSALHTSVTNLGTQGGSVGIAVARSNSLTYPKSVDSDIITGDGWASELSYFKENCNNEGRRYNMSFGEGYGLAVPVPASFNMSLATGGYYAILTGPRGDMLDEVSPVVFDPTTDEDLKYLGGEPRVEPSSGEVPGAQWRQGAPYYYPSNWEETLTDLMVDAPLARDPIKIDNWRFGEYQTQGPPGAPSSRSDEWPEEIIISKWATLPGVTFTRKTMGWSYPAWDDFFITELEFENTGDSDGDGVRDLPEETLTNVFVPIINNFMVSQAGFAHNRSGDQWFHYHKGALDDWIAYSENPGYSGPAKGLKMLLDWDGDSPEFSWDDTGDAWNKLLVKTTCDTKRPDGEFTGFQYAGFGPLAYQDGGEWTFNSRDVGKYVQPEGEQPHTLRFWRIESETASDDPRPSVHDRKTMYDMLTNAGIDANPSQMGVFYVTQTYGPYTLDPGEKGKLVVAWSGGSAAGEGDIFAWMRSHLRDFGSLPDGEKWAVEFFKRAKWAYDNEYDLPDAPPDVYAMVANSPNATNQITWNSADDAVNPDYGEKDVAGYRIYRGDWSPDGPWELVADVPKGTTTYEDVESAAGFLYWYAVRSYATGHQDWTGRVGTMATLPGQVQSQVKGGMSAGQWARSQRVPRFVSPKQIAVDPTERMNRQPIVVPNPYRRDDPNLQYPGRIGVRFVNVPSKCWIYIFNYSGDLVAQVLHDDRTAAPDNPDAWLGEASWDLVTMAEGTGRIPAGIYFFTVESLVPESQGQLKSGKFMIIR